MFARHSLRSPVIILGGFLIVLSWIVAELKIRSDNRALTAEALSDLTNYSLLFQQDVLRAASELDRTLKYLRNVHDRSQGEFDWATLVKEDFTNNARTVQIAIIDEHGMMITSSASPYPKQKIDLSDREHFRVHLNSQKDFLFVSKPIRGRVTGKWSVQFTRRFTKKDGTFGGVIVVSLDPAELVAAYERLDSRPSVGFALAGSDDVVRAGGGSYAAQIGRGLVDGNQQEFVTHKSKQVTIVRELFKDEWRISAERTINGYDLLVRVRMSDPVQTRLAVPHIYHGYAGTFSIAILLLMVSSFTRQQLQFKRIVDLAHTDTLTKLLNRHSFTEVMNSAYDDVSKMASMSLHLIDLDKFKAVNDTFGHPVGDELLRAVATRLKSSVRENDLVFRLGGDEFALIQTDCQSQSQAGSVAKRICSAMAQPFSISGHAVFIGASIGVALKGADLTNSTALLKAADMSLYQAKAEGRGTYRFYEVELEAALQRRRTLENDLRDAIEKGTLEVHYQPKVKLGDTTDIVGYEALVRWRHPVRGMIMPSEFIPLAEETGLIAALGNWVIREACFELARRPGPQTVAVNCSPLQFSDGNLVATISDALTSSGLDASRLEIEITESTLMRDDKTIVTQLAALRTKGIVISLDDFGTGYSSLSYLEKYPIDCIKIDRSFVAKLGDRPRAAPIVRAIVTLAAELSMTTIAEGIETQTQADLLKALGCTMAQGYLFGRPCPASETWAEQLTKNRVA